jgi:Fe2+ or Zn2+ uptake regulation protein
MRVTSQRSLIIDIIRQGHFDADEIFRRAKEKEPRLSLSTVYRTLQKLKKLGLVEELHFDEGHHHYEAKPSTEHYHMVCLGCGKVIELRQPLSEVIKQSAEAEDFDIVETEVRVTGYCAKCRKKRR